jgi:hypothetical protein
MKSNRRRSENESCPRYVDTYKSWIKNKIMKTEKFKILCGDFLGGITIRKTEGERITIEGVECFIHTKIDETFHGLIDYYFISHLETGHYICYDLDKDAAIKKAGEKLKDKDLLKKVLERTKKETNFKYPVNL